ncbi:glycosyltransferase [Algoriphagus sediminis]|uniref:Glycosyltransferase n=1 Tax=Algoriphagus sediminis TaxID=3057113 RepID=A0ABT7Y988_9BACT|nr:glycosyltransferase [Algoriphagus sediminis]MDN3203036.1 glycosyltransferase [Algoriphagus sediminis]
MIFLIVGLSVYASFQFLVLIFLLHFFWKNHHTEDKNPKRVSVLVTSRNEEVHLPQLLKSLEELDYPAEQIDFWMADDQSKDSTATILKNWCDKVQNRNFVAISESENGIYHGNGKSNALAILSKKAKGEIFFFTDADCVVPKTWILEGVSAIGDEMDMLLGVTQVRSKTLFGKLQEVDWWHTLGIVKVTSDMGLSLTGLGNNMLVRRESIKACGGFEGLSDSLTEDLALSQKILKNRGKIGQQVSAEILAYTKAEENWSDFLRQRKRWLSGVVTLPWYIQFLLGLELLFYPAIIGLVLISPFYGISLWVLKIFLQSIYLISFASKAGRKIPPMYLFLFDFYQLFTGLISIIYYFWPSKIVWKSRKY